MEASTRTEPTMDLMGHDDVDPDTHAAPDPGAAIVEARIAAFAGAEHARVVAAVSVWCGSVDDATDADIATHLRAAPGTVRATLHQARMALADQLSEEV